MASSNWSQSSDLFLCSVCLDIFTNPVSTPCGHNFCHDCITTFWSLRSVRQCPLCKDTFQGSVQLQVNREFRDLLEVFKGARLPRDDGAPPAGPGEVTCDLCCGRKSKAVKSCLVCLASYCSVHLEPHGNVEALRWHKLVEPVRNLQHRVCSKHNRVVESFCREDRCCVCPACLRDEHAEHHAVSLEAEVEERRTQLKVMKKKVEELLSEKHTTMGRITRLLTRSRQEVENIKAEAIKAFDSLVASLESSKVKLVKLLEEKQKSREQEAEEVLRQLQLEVLDNQEMITKLEDLSKDEDDFTLLQDLPSLSSSSLTKEHLWGGDRLLLNPETVRNVAAAIQQMVDREMDNILTEIDLEDEEESADGATDTQEEKVFNDHLEELRRRYSTNVTLNPNTAHPSLLVSADRKKVRDAGRKRRFPDNPARFDFLHFVLGNQGFSSNFYYEVAVQGQAGWELGVVRESISRKGFDVSLSPENGCWTLGSYGGRYQANASPPVVLKACKHLQKVGVFVSYTDRCVSFFDVNARTLVYSFTKCAFTAVAHGGASSLFPIGSPAKTKIYPLFRPSGDGSGPLQITPTPYQESQESG